jgi:hypothetical protein
MRRLHWPAVVSMASMVAATMACAQAPVVPPMWMDTANWANVHPVATRNIVYANVPVPGNPSANPNPGTAGGGIPRVPNLPTAAPGTLDLHLDVLQISSPSPLRS